MLEEDVGKLAGRSQAAEGDATSLSGTTLHEEIVVRPLILGDVDITNAFEDCMAAIHGHVPPREALAAPGNEYMTLTRHWHSFLSLMSATSARGQRVIDGYRDATQHLLSFFKPNSSAEPSAVSDRLLSADGALTEEALESVVRPHRVADDITERAATAVDGDSAFKAVAGRFQASIDDAKKRLRPLRHILKKEATATDSRPEPQSPANLGEAQSFRERAAQQQKLVAVTVTSFLPSWKEEVGKLTDACTVFTRASRDKHYQYLIDSARTAVHVSGSIIDQIETSEPLAWLKDQKTQFVQAVNFSRLGPAGISTSLKELLSEVEQRTNPRDKYAFTLFISVGHFYGALKGARSYFESQIWTRTGTHTL